MIRELNTDAIAGLQGMTPEHAERRRKFITASDFPAILGLDKYRNAADVYFDKLGVVLPDKGSAPASIGTGVEPALLNMCELVVDAQIHERQAWRPMTTGEMIGATIDGFADALVDIKRRQSVVNAKSSGLDQEWAEEPPARVIVQCQVEIACTGAEAALIPVLLGGFGPLKFRVFVLERDDAMIRDLVGAGVRFMEDFVAKEQMPFGEPPHLETLRRIRRVPKQIVSLDAEIMRAWTEAREARLAIEKQVKNAAEIEDRALRAMLAQMGDAEAAESEVGVFSYMETNRKGYVVAPSTYRSAKFKARETQEVTS